MSTKSIRDTQGNPLTLTSWGLDVYGRTVWLCPHAVVSLPLVQQLAQQRGVITGRLPLMQAYGSADDSGPTHLQGTAVDVGLLSRALVAIFRECGWQATWRRGPAYGQASMDPHTHAALRCPCRAGADYQLGAVVDGYNGLGAEGRAGRDYEARPHVWRDWESGLDWLKSQLAPPIPPTPKEDDMQLLDKMPSPFNAGEEATVQYALWAAPRYAFAAFNAVRALTEAFTAYVVAEKGADAAISKQLTEAAAAIKTAIDELDVPRGVDAL